MIVPILAILIAASSLGLSLLLWQRVQDLTRQCDELRRSPVALNRDERPVAALEEASKPLEGLRVVLAISQDHPHAVFAGILRERLLREDIVSVEEFGGAPADALSAWRSGRLDADLLISGGLTCNGYAEVYYSAEFTCFTPGEAVYTIMEKPAGGDRPENLAREIVSQLGGRLDQLVKRSERRRAIAELHGD